MAFAAGQAFVQVVPSMQGFGSKISKQLSAPMAAAGKQGGQQLGDAASSTAGTALSKGGLDKAIAGPIAAGTSDAKSKFQDLATKGRANAATLSTAFSGLAKVALGVGVVLGATALALKPIASAALGIDKTSKTLTGLYGSGSAAADMMARLKKISDSSPIDPKAFQQAATGLAYLGLKGKPAADIIDNVGKAIVAAGGDASQLKSVTDGLAQIQNEGKVSVDALNQISGAGVPIFSGLAKKFGVSIGQVRKMVESGKVGLTDVTSVMQNATGKTFQDMKKGAAGANKSVSNQMAILKNRITNNLATAAQPLLKLLIPAFARLASFITSSVLPAITSVFGWMAQHTTTVKVIAAAVGLVTLAFTAFAAVVIAGMVPSLVAAAAAQWGLNAAMLANPVGLVVAGLILLVGGIILAYKHSATFRAIVQAVGIALKTAFLAVVNAVKTAFNAVVSFFSGVISFISAHWKLILSIIGGPLAALVILVVTHFGQIKAFIGSVLSGIWGAIKIAAAIITTIWLLLWTGIKRVVMFVFGPIIAYFRAQFALMKAAFTLVKNAIILIWTAVWTRVKAVALAVFGPIIAWFRARLTAMKLAFGVIMAALRKAWGVVWAAIKAVVVRVFGPIVAWFRARLASIRAAFSAVGAAIRSVWSALWSRIKSVASTTFNAVKKGITTVLNGVKGAFRTAVSAIGAAWNKIKKLAKTPVQFVVNNVVIPLIKKYNGVAKSFGAKTFAVPAKMATGGRVRGPGTGTSDSIPTYLSNGEFVVNAKSTRENLGLLHALNGKQGAGYKKGGYATKNGAPAFAEGGLFGKLGGFFANAKKFTGDITGVIKHPVEALKHLLSGPLGTLKGLTNTDFGSWVRSIPDKLMAAVGKKLSALAEKFGGGGGNADAIIRTAKKMNGSPYVWGGAKYSGADCSGFQSILRNVGKNDKPFQRRMFTTSSFSGGRNIAGFQRGLNSNYQVSVNPGSHIWGKVRGSDGKWYGVESGGSWGRVHFGGASSIRGGGKYHYGLKFNTGGVVDKNALDGLPVEGMPPAYLKKMRKNVLQNASTFDGGGLLHKGTHLVQHNMRKPDKVLSDKQFADMHKLAGQEAGGQFTGTLTLDNGAFLGQVQGQIDSWSSTVAKQATSRR